MNKKTLSARARHWWRKEIRPLLIMAVIMFSIRSSLADWNDVPTGSMKPTILEGDRVFVNKLAFDLKVPFTTRHLAEWGQPSRGDIVVFFSPHDGMRLVKRTIGLPGDVIAMRDNQLFVNGQAVGYAPLDARTVGELPAREQAAHGFAEELLPERKHAVMTTPQNPAPRTFAPITVPSGHYFMMGDNRDDSFDSRFYGCVAREKIVGRVPSVVISMDPKAHYRPRWHRFFTMLP